MTFLVTGGCGFIGSNIAHQLLSEGKQVTVFDNLSRHGSAQNLEWLRQAGLTNFIQGDIRNQEDVQRLIATAQPTVIFHLCGQVAMTTSMQNPRQDFEINVIGSINLLEAVRLSKSTAAIVYASSNKVYGDLATIRLSEEDKRYTAVDFPDGINESAPLDFQTPYGCSKGSADQYMLDYARNYGLNTVVFRHSTVYGGRQFATYDQGWVGWFCQQALHQARDPSAGPFTISGNGKQVRDLLCVDDAVKCYRAAADHSEAARGQAFNIGGGMANSCSLLELFDELESILKVKLRYRPIEWRQGDQKFFVSATGKAQRILGWQPATSKKAGIASMCEWVKGIG